MKKQIALLLVLIIALSACGKGAKDEKKGEEKEVVAIHKKPIDNQFKGKTLKLVTFTKDMEYAARAFEEAYACEVEVIYKEQAEMKDVLAKLNSGEAVEDVYTIESGDMQEWLKEDATLPLTDVSAENYAAYTTAYATDKNGNLKALTFSVTPVNLYYRRSIAKAVLQDDSPEAVASQVASIGTLNELAGKLHAGGYKLFANKEDMKSFYLPLDKAERNVISPEESAFLNTVKQMEAEYRLAGLTKWSPDWFKGMYGSATNPITGKKLDVFGYVMPSWAKSYILEKAGDSKQVADSTENVQNPTWGDWAMTTLPRADFSDGIWLGIGKNTAQAEMAKAFLIYVTQNQLFLEKWFERTQELPAYLPVLESYRLEAEDSFLGGQKVMPLYIETVKAIPTKSAEQIASENQYYAILEEYIDGKLPTIESLQEKLAVPNPPEQTAPETKEKQQ